MSWVFLGSILVVAMTGAVILPRRARQKDQRNLAFPWFWVCYPVAVFGIVSTIGMVLDAQFSTIYNSHEDPIGLAMPYPDGHGFPGLQFLSSEQYRQLFGPLPVEIYLAFFPLLAVVGVVSAVIAWRKGRV
ncbi:hypothetical protein ACT3SZ_11085 [Corynebacterium sp. AOP40-9SA-29]|uniref:hypothetical protein n=1 Tax=Corynebacterium sp. AOP40-9SA-29 TaxID=3457677 RepID=UPI004033FEB5